MGFDGIYLDNGATTKVDPQIIEVMNKYHLEEYGNASSVHMLGSNAKMALEKARRAIAKSINANEGEVIFTSGGTESNNFTLKGVAFANKEYGNHIVTTRIEHSCILETCKWLETQGFKITYLGVDAEGFVDPKELENAITNKTIVVSIIHANNEVGTIQNLKELGEICERKKVYFHTDACQSYTKVELDVKKQKLTFVSLNSHKIHGPKGVGALYIREGSKITPLMHGGGHERGFRAGTENIPGIAGFAEAARLAMDKRHVEQMSKLRDKLIEGVLKIEGVRLNGPTGEKRLCNNANFSFKGIEGEAIGGYLDAKGICSSTGSACSSRKLEPSHVLKTMGLSDEEANGSLRMTLSRFTTEKHIDQTLEALPDIVKKLRKISTIGKVIGRVF